MVRAVPGLSRLVSNLTQTPEFTLIPTGTWGLVYSFQGFTAAKCV